MTAALRTLPLPQLVSADDNKENAVVCWDDTLVADDALLKKDIQPALCSHATSQGNIVYGFKNSDRGEDTDWILWHASLPDKVCQVCSNKDGSIVAASTAAGTVSLLSGTDGTSLATRKVSQSHPAAQITFVSTSKNKDSLLIVVPTTGDVTQVIVVGNIDGPAFSCTDTIAEAIHSMSIDAFSVPQHVSEIQGLEKDNEIQLVTKTNDGQISFYKFSWDTKKLVAVESAETGLKITSNMIIQHSPNNAYLAVGLYKNKKHSVAWYNLTQRSITCEMESSIAVRNIQALQSCSTDAVALALITEESSILIVQVVIEETMGLDILKDPHVIHEVPVTLKSNFAMAAASSHSNAYCFRLCSVENNGNMQCHEFKAAATIGKIRLLLYQRRFDEAEFVLQQEYQPCYDCSDFHPTEVALYRLKYILQQPLTHDIILMAQDCLKKFVGFEESDLAAENMLDAVNVILSWQSPSLPVYRSALAAIVCTLEAAQTLVSPELSEKISKKLEKVNDCDAAMGAIEKLLGDEDIHLDGNFSKVRSTAKLLKVLLLEGLFGAAQSLSRSVSQLSPEVIVSTIVSLPPTVDPTGYVSILINDGILRLHATHELLPTLSTWACQTADELVDVDELESAVFLLQKVHDALIRLQAKIFSPFSTFCPFVPASVKVRQTSPRNSESTSIDFESSQSLSSTFDHSSAGSKTIKYDQKVPTILQLGRLKGGAIKSRVVAIKSSRDDLYDDDCDDIDVKLRQANVLHNARQLGIGCKAASLRQFIRRGGSMYIAKELVRMYSSGAQDNASRVEVLQSKVKAFCDDAEVSFDHVLLSYGNEICDSKHLNQATLGEASSLARCCIKNNMKCQITLTVLRAALLCGISALCLTQLSADALVWCGGDLKMKSEVTEATRLLTINNIVVTYCGSDAALELFRVDNPSHAAKLLTYVCRHVTYTNVLSDALKLCDAFTHLSKEHACEQILEVALVSESVETCAHVLKQIFENEVSVAEQVWMKALEFCSMTLSCMGETRRLSKFESIQDDAKAREKEICLKAIALLEVVQDSMTAESLKETPFESFLDSYQRVTKLQHHHAIFISPLELECRDRQIEIVQSLMYNVRQEFGNESNHSLSRFEGARRACELLVGNTSINIIAPIWFPAVKEEACHLVWSASESVCVEFLKQSGAINEISNTEAAQAVLSVILNFCKRAGDVKKDSSEDLDTISKMKLVLRASQLLNGHIILACPPKLLPIVSSLSVLTETVCKILLMADNGVGDELGGYKQQLRSNKETDQMSASHSMFKKPSLHPSWFVGDGLFLPMHDTHERCINLCVDMVGLNSFTQSPILRSADKLQSLLTERGCHASALRVSCLTAMNIVSSITFDPLANYQQLTLLSNSYHLTMQCLAERSLGGDGQGITNPQIDSELARSYLYMLPSKLAFRMFTASLPAAISKRDFKRVKVLSNIGIVACQGISSNHIVTESVPPNWKKQVKFSDQCNRLSTRAQWWMALQRYQVDFDPKKFEESSKLDSSAHDAVADVKKEAQYVATLLKPLISHCCEQVRDADVARQVALRFASAFKIDTQLVWQKHVSFLVACPLEENKKHDTRLKLDYCERAIRFSLKHVSAQTKRIALLRKAVVELESNRDFDKDYERHHLILSLYAEQLVCMMKGASPKKVQREVFTEELESIQRRLDALSVLMSFFEGDHRKMRPTFPQFFSPLNLVLNFDDRKRNNERVRIGVLGPINDCSNPMEDPLSPLQPFLNNHPDTSIATALAPLCIPLNLPSGYVHARALVARFQQAKISDGLQPSLETEVLPVLNRLKTSKDQSILSEWCAFMYKEDDEQSMKCLDIALDYAMKASSEIEQKLQKHSNITVAAEEQEALDRVRRLSNQKRLLSDKKEVNQILQDSKYGDADQFRTVKTMIDDIAGKLNEELWGKVGAAPDDFVEILLTEASLIASRSCVSTYDAFALDHLRYMASVVHRACKGISDQYSHVHVGAMCRKLARRWLVHGDSGPSIGKNESSKTLAKHNSTISFDPDDDDTVNFVMDLNDNHDLWADDVVSCTQVTSENNLVTKEEEPSALDPIGCAREVSESACSRIALRIAFVMSFADGYHPKQSDILDFDDNIGEETKKNTTSTQTRKKQNTGLLSRISVGHSNHDSSVMDHGRELLSIVFARPGVSKDQNDPSLSFLSIGCNESIAKTATFAMRYRALKTASILCPQEALERIVLEERYLQSNGSDARCTLRQCTFALFVAKEVEEMGLVLPHSDLAKLSTMQYSSYARVLQKNHNTHLLKTKGRFLLLLVEMGTVHGQSYEETFVASILSELNHLHLTRSLLLACERYTDFITSQNEESFEDRQEVINSCIATIIQACVKEGVTSMTMDKLETFIRITNLFGKLPDICSDLVKSFANGLFDIISSSASERIRVDLIDLAISLLGYTRDKHIREELQMHLSQVNGVISNQTEKLTSATGADEGKLKRKLLALETNRVFRKRKFSDVVDRAGE